jgi:hypothetical protein
MPNRAELLKQKFETSVGLPLVEVLPEEWIQQVLEEAGVGQRESIYTPMVTLWAWLSQILDPDKSLQNTVNRIVSWLVEAGLKVPSRDTGAYSKARQRLPVSVIEHVFLESAQALQAHNPPENQWCGRRVLAYDGTSVTLMDTPANQAKFPQHSNQKPGCGQPIARLVVWFCLTTGAIVQVALSGFLVSEWELSRRLYSGLSPGDVGLADSAYGTYADMALIQQSGADGVMRKHQARATDFRRGKRLGQGDHLVTWSRPQQSALSPEELASLPETLTVREVCFQVEKPGFRSQKIILVTTLLDAQQYSKAQLAALYRLRWTATEVNLRHLKTTLKMEMIYAKTPEIVTKDLWMHLLAYNLLRLLMLQSARRTQVNALRLSLQGTRQMFNQFRALFAASRQRERQRLYDSLLLLLGQDLVPLRPDRVEPRVLKRRPKNFPRMQLPRQFLKLKLIA